MTLNEYVLYMRDALNRFQAVQEKHGLRTGSFSHWWRSLHHHVRSEHPRTIELPVKPAVSDPEDFKANLPTRPRARRH
jgi:hypothetical protein